MLSEKDNKIIDDYLLGRLSEDDIAYVESRLEEEIFRQELQLRMALSKVVQEEGANQLKQSLQMLEKKVGPTTKRTQKRIWPFSVAAAIIAFVIYVGIRQNSTPSAAQLEDLFYSIYPNTVDPVTKSEPSAFSPFQHYEIGAYGEALRSFANQQDEPATFYMAMSHFYLDEFQTAGELYQRVIDSRSTQYAEAAQWFLALTRFHQKRKPEAMEIWQYIEDEAGHPYRSDARELLLFLRQK